MKSWIVLLVLGLLILGVDGFIYYNLPKEVCTTNYITTKYTVNDCSNPLLWMDTGFPEYSLESEILCEDGIQVETYENLGIKVIYGNCVDDANKICMIKEPIETCEVIYK